MSAQTDGGMTHDRDAWRRECVVSILTKALERVPEPNTHKHFGLSRGAALHALFLSDMARALERPDLMEDARAHIMVGAELLNEEALSTSLYRSAPGYAWVLHAMAADGGLPWAHDFLDDMDQLLADSLEASGDSLNIDLINGVAGILVYAMSRAPSSGADRLAVAIDAWFCRRFAYWKAGYRVRDAKERPPCDQDLGIAHGVPGVLAAFGLSDRRRWLSAEAREILHAGYDYVWASANPSPAGEAYFPSHNGGTRSARVAWCYGNLGSAVAYSHDASQHVRANRLIRHALHQYESSHHGIKDVSLCHGEAGVALLFSLMSRCSHVEAGVRARCELASNVALERTLAAAEVGDHGIAFPYFTSKSGYIDADSFLEGWVGVCLASCAVVEKSSPKWIELLLLSDLT